MHSKLNHQHSSSLIVNYINTAYRSLTKDNINLFLSIFGLAIGLAASFLIALYAINESAYDKYQPNIDNNFRLVMQSDSGNKYALSTPRAYRKIKNIEGVADVAFLMNTHWFSDNKIQIGTNFLKLKESYSTTENINDFISLNTLHGDLSVALSQPDRIALSRTESMRLFGVSDSVGKTFVKKANNKIWTVAAVFADIPNNSHFAFSSLVAAAPYENVRGNIAHLYVSRLPMANTEQIANGVTKIFADIWHWENAQYHLQPVADIHLSENFSTDMKVGGSASNVTISIVLSILLLLISSFNTINMSIAQAGHRAKEVGVRKVLGASKLQLVGQFLLESIALTFVSALIAAVLVELYLPNFNQLIDRQLSVGNWSPFILPIVVTTIAIGIFSGLYPAIFIASFNIKRVLSGDFRRGKSAVIVRKTLMVFQSALSIGLIIAAINLYLQLAYLQNLPVNYEKSHRLMVKDAPVAKIFSKDSESLYQALTNIDGVKSATAIDFDLTDKSNAGFFVKSVAGIENFEPSLSHGGVGFNAVQTLGLDLIAGRDFSAQYAADWYSSTNASSAIIIPESLLGQAGYENAEQAIGKVWVYSAGPAQNIAGTIVGVVKDVKIGSVRNQSLPLVLVCGLPIGVYSIIIELDHLNNTDTQSNSEIQKQISTLLGKRLAMSPVEIQSIQTNYQALYQGDERLVQVVAIFSGLAIVLTCIGMFGLAAFSAQRRKREISIRKVLGASPLTLVNLLTQESIILVGISIFIAFPCVYLLLENWLSYFNERIAQSFSIYIFSAFTVVFITCLTVSFLAFKTATAKPSQVLRSE